MADNNKLKFLDSILSLLFWPLAFGWLMLCRYAHIPAIIFFVTIFGYTLITRLIADKTLEVDNNRKKLILYFDGISMSTFVILMIINYFWGISILTYLIIISVWLVLIGIVGLYTNAILLTNGSPYICSDKGFWGRISNTFIIIMGIVILIYSCLI